MNMENSKTNSDQLSFKTIVRDLYASKIIIISIVIASVLLTGSYAFFLIDPLYNTRVKIAINMPKEHASMYGRITNLDFKGEHYVNLATDDIVIGNTIKSLENELILTEGDLKESISVTISNAAGYNVLTIKVTADSADKSMAISQAFYDSYLKHISVTFNEGAMRFLSDQLNANKLTWTNAMHEELSALRINEDLISTSQKYIDLQELNTALTGTGNYFIVENIINPVYARLENDIVANKQIIEGLKNSLKENEEMITKLNEGLEALVAVYYEDGEIEIDPVLIDVEKYVYLTEQPLKPSQNTGPSPVKLMVLAAVAGLVLGAGIALTKKR